ncbi:MAG: hypothetical protein L0I62_06000 [Gammaproteobacteria bacterium]|nr:hypothetical protein [Gammaproteobacteria bacterium]
MLRFSRLAALLGALLIAAPLAAQPLVYVTDPSADTLTAINSGNNTIERTLGSIDQARAVSISADGTRVYVAATAANGAGIVVVIDGAKVADQNQDPVIAEIKVGGDPVAVAYDTISGLLYVADAETKNVKAYKLDGLDPDNPQAAATYDGGDSLDAMALSPDGQLLALASTQANSVTLYNLRLIAAGQSGESILTLDAAPLALQYSPLGEKLWIATDKGFAVFDASTGVLSSTQISGGTNSIAPDPRTGRIYFGATSGDVYVHTPNSPLIDTIATNGPVSGIALSADGTRLYAVQRCNNCGLTVIDTAIGQAFHQIFFGTAPDTAGQFAGPGAIYAPNGATSGAVDEQMSGSVKASDYNNRSLAYAVIQPPLHGQLNFNTTGDYAYTPLTGSSGVEAFAWQAIASSGEGSPNEARSRPIIQTLYILPTVSTIGDQTGQPDSTLGPLEFSIAGSTPLLLKLKSSNSDLVAAGQITVSSGCGTTSMDCTLKVPIKNVANGSTKITLTAIGPDGLTASSSFAVKVGSGENDGGGALAPFVLGGLLLMAGLALARRRRQRKAHEGV